MTTKGERREQKQDKRRRYKTSGKSVFLLLEIIMKKAKLAGSK
jgi:hypothetical protein